MKKPNAKTIERVKDILLVVLFFTTVLLLYFFWENATKEPFRLSDIMASGEMENDEITNISTVIPTEITVSFGNQIYTVIRDRRDELWNEAITELKKFGENAGSKSASVSEITREKYDTAVSLLAQPEDKNKAVNQYQSIQFQFHYNIPFQEFCEKYGIKKNPGFEIIEAVTTIAYSEMSPESILVYQQGESGKNDKYFAIVADKPYTDFAAVISAIEQSGYVNYYPATAFFGNSVQNLTLLPLSLQSDLLEVKYDRESAGPEDAKVRDLAESFFGENLDFVRRNKDAKGNIMYMYGYGQKVFNINADGSFEYKEESTGNNGKSTGFFDSLAIGIQFVKAHGSWNSLDGTDVKPYLKKAIPISEEKKSGYRFIFSMKIGTQNIYFESGAPIIIEVVNGQVTCYKRNMIDFEENTPSGYASGEAQDTYDPVKVLTENYEQIYESLKSAGVELAPVENQEGAFNQIAGMISSMEIGYLRQNANEGEENVLRPCYRISFGKKLTMYFDLFNDAEPIGAEINEVSAATLKEGK